LLRPDARPVYPGDDRGSTLLELLLTLALFSILVGGILLAWRHSQQAYFHGAEAAQVQQNARVAVEQMVREIRQARGITVAEANRIAITSVLDENSRTYELSGSASPSYRYSLVYTKPGPPAPDCTTPCPIADYIVAGGLVFSYRDAGGNALTPPVTAANRLLIRQVDVAVRVQPALADADPPIEFASSAKLRNR
jgi:prepilin-type N-terminal cleavage/methylation domain-containing protein